MSVSGREMFQPFVWTGLSGGRLNNTNAFRFSGGAQLARLQEKLRREYPTAKIFVIAHSHGGNVALYAQRQADPLSVADAVVTLGTPFVVIEKRDIEGDLVAATVVGEFSFVTWVMFLLAMVLAIAIPGMLGSLLLSTEIKILKPVGYFLFVCCAICGMAFQGWALVADGTE